MGNSTTVEPAEGVREQIARALQRARESGRPVLVSRSLPTTPPVDVLALVEHARAAGTDTMLWERPAAGLAIAGIGVAWAATAHGATRFRDLAAACEAIRADALIEADAAAADPGPFFLSAFAFASEVDPEGPWREFPPGRMMLPRVLVVRRDHRATLTVSALVEPWSDVEVVRRRLARDVSALEEGASPVRSDAVAGTCYEAVPVPSLARWKGTVSSAIAAIAGGDFEKLVLARTCAVRSDREFDCARVYRRLRRAYPSCAAFWIGTPSGHFLGATPELLVRLAGRTVSTAATAGSAERGTCPASDRALAHTLVASAKDRHEHAIVVDAIAAALRPLCDHLDVPPLPQILPLQNVQHLTTPITGQLSHPTPLLDLVDRLHPTPAVAGHPRETALAALRAREGLDRGWYAGPIGWMDTRGDGEFVVAIRSALIRGSEASLYAGAGIVADSDPDAELDETRLKLQPLLSALMDL